MDSDYLMSDKLIHQMVDRMILNQELNWTQEFKKHEPPALFRQHFQTVRVHLPRRSGHTTVAETLWMKYGAIVVFPTYDWMKRFLDDVRRRAYVNEHSMTVPLTDFCTNRCFVADDYDALNRFNVKLVQLKNSSRTQLPELLVFDGATWLGKNSRIELDEIKKALSDRYVRREWADIERLLESVYYQTRTWEEIVEHLTSAAFTQIPTLKGVVVLQ